MKKTLRDMSYDDYGISKNRYRELLYFCRQYEEKKQKMKYGVSSPISDGLPHGNMTGNPTQQAAIHNLIYARDVNLMEQAALEACGVLYTYILINVSDGTPYEYLGDVPVCQKDFYAYRRLFFSILDKKLTTERGW